jgi:hypothetical protein
VRRPIALAVCALTLASCSSRTPTLLPDGSPPDGARREGAPGDRPRLVVEGGAREGGLPDSARGELPGFCSGVQPRLVFNSASWQVTEVRGATAVLASCCGPGELVRFLAVDAVGKPKEVSLEIVRFPNAPAANHVDVAKPPAGWVVAVRCDSADKCGLLRSDSATLAGSVDYAYCGAIPCVRLDICIAVSASASSPPGFSSLGLYARQVLVNMACTQGMDQSCNEDPKVSSLRGKCNDDSTCTCVAGATKVTSSGKCL